MGSSGSSFKSSGYTWYNHSSWVDIEDYGTVQVRSKRIKKALGLGVHHAITVEIGDSNWRVFQWGCADGKYPFEHYKIWKINTNYCLDLGRHKCKDVYEAAKSCSNIQPYSSDYNCNDWCEAVARKLGRNIKVHWNCKCVL